MTRGQPAHAVTGDALAVDAGLFLQHMADPDAVPTQLRADALVGRPARSAARSAVTAVCGQSQSFRRNRRYSPPDSATIRPVATRTPHGSWVPGYGTFMP